MGIQQRLTEQERRDSTPAIIGDTPVNPEDLMFADLRLGIWEFLKPWNAWGKPQQSERVCLD